MDILQTLHIELPSPSDLAKLLLENEKFQRGSITHLTTSIQPLSSYQKGLFVVLWSNSKVLYSDCSIILQMILKLDYNSITNIQQFEHELQQNICSIVGLPPYSEVTMVSIKPGSTEVVFICSFIFLVLFYGNIYLQIYNPLKVS